MGRIPTIKDIAAEVGLSVTAVSKALNNKGGISEEAVRRIKDAAKKLNYKPNSVAKSLKLSNTNTIGVVVSDSSSSLFAKVIRGIGDTADREGYDIILCNTDGEPEKERKAINVLINKRIDGIIIAASTLTRVEDARLIEDMGIPYTYLIRKSEFDEADYVVNDNVLGAYMMVNYLLRSSKQKIHFLNLTESTISAVDRTAGYRKALEENGVVFDPSLITYVKPEIEDGYAAMRQILERNEDVKTVFCGCDVIAIGAMEAIIERGLRVPNDVRIAGYDDIDFAAYLRVPLTTVRQPKYLIGSKGTEVLINKIQKKTTGVQHIILKPEIIVRESS